MRDRYGKGYAIKIITHQGRLTHCDGNVAPEAELFERKIEQIVDTLDLPLTVYAACGNDNWRTPRVGIWELLIRKYVKKGQAIDEKPLISWVTLLVGPVITRMRTLITL
jgi:bifunctional polynucleotide phosphatase/kinase